jgi:hypothetical protein
MDLDVDKSVGGAKVEMAVSKVNGHGSPIMVHLLTYL